MRLLKTNKQTWELLIACGESVYFIHGNIQRRYSIFFFLLANMLECGLPSIFTPPVFLLFPPHHPVSRLQAADRSSPSEADTGRDALVPFFYCSGQFNYDNDALTTKLVFLIF